MFAQSQQQNTITCETITFNLNDDDGDCITNAIDEDDDRWFDDKNNGALEFEGLYDWGGNQDIGLLKVISFQVVIYEEIWTK